MDSSVQGSRAELEVVMNCTECKSALWDYEEYYGTSERQYFVCGYKEDKDPELCANGVSMTDKIKMYAEDIAKIITETEEIQDSNESAYTKEMAMINAYFNIVLLVGSE